MKVLIEGDLIMGEYLHVGVCTRWTFEKQEWERSVSVEGVRNALGEKMGHNLYEVNETEDFVEFNLKPSLFMEEIHAFLAKQFSMFGQSDNERWMNKSLTTLEAIKACETVEELMKLAADGRIRSFHQMEITDFLDIDRDVSVPYECEMIVYFDTDKILLESGYEVFSYLENLIRASNTEFDISRSVLVEVV